MILFQHVEGLLILQHIYPFFEDLSYQPQKTAFATKTNACISERAWNKRQVIWCDRWEVSINELYLFASSDKLTCTTRLSFFARPLSNFWLRLFLWYLYKNKWFRVLSRVFEGKSFPPKMPSFPPPKKILLSLQYISNYIGKIIQTRRGQCRHCNISQNCVSECTRLHLSTYSFQNISRGGMPFDPPRKLMAFGHSGLLPQTVNPK